MSIKNWKEDDRPREKFYLKGRNAISDSELLAILIGMGNKEHSALDIAKIMLSDNGNSLEKLGRLSIKELMKYKGIGEAKAIAIAAALELGNRRQGAEKIQSPKIKSSLEAFHLFKTYLTGLNHEEFYAAFLSRNNSILKVEKISMGGTSATIVDFKIIAKLAIENLASSVIVTHNHPSGNLTPSKADDNLTQNLKSALSLFEINLHDHIILAENKYFSYADEGRI